MTGVDAERHQLQDRYDALLPLYREGLISDGELRTERLILQERLEALADDETAQARRKARKRLVISSAQAWENATVEERAATIRTLVDRIVIRPSTHGKKSGPKFDYDRVQLEWRKPMDVEDEPMPLRPWPLREAAEAQVCEAE